MAVTAFSSDAHAERATTVWWARRAPLETLDLSILSAAERQRVDGLGTTAGRERSALARVVVRLALAELLDGSPSSFALDWKDGPALSDRSQGPCGLRLSVSHSGDRVAVAVSTAGDVGVDIEPLARAQRIGPGVMGQVCSPHERAAICALPGPQRAAAELRLWTAKEAVLKATGDGLRLAPQGVELAGAPHPDRLLRCAGHPELACQLVPLTGDDDYAGTLAVLTSAPAPVTERDAGALLAG